MVSGLGIPTGTYVGAIDTADSTNTIHLADRTGAAVTFTIQAAGTYTFAAPAGKGTYTVSASQTILSTTVTGTKTVASLDVTGVFTTLNSITGSGTP